MHRLDLPKELHEICARSATARAAWYHAQSEGMTERQALLLMITCLDRQATGLFGLLEKHVQTCICLLSSPIGEAKVLKPQECISES